MSVESRIKCKLALEQRLRCSKNSVALLKVSISISMFKLNTNNTYKDFHTEKT